MDSLFKALARTAAWNLPFTRMKMLQREFLRTTPSCLGVYPSFAAAEAAAPPAEQASYDHTAIAENYKKGLNQFRCADYPIIFWLARLLPEARVVFELGGSIGTGFYSCDRYLRFSPDLRWIVCDLPSTIRVGAEIARERNAHQLTFTTERETDRNPDIYATFGTLQYIEEPFVAIIAQLRIRPPHILVNRVPMTEGDAFITLQNNASWFSPYKVDNRTAFNASIVALGYELVDEWRMDSHNVFLTENPDEPKLPYCGMYFRLKSQPASAA
jgi:putative methyltransferase (TIGR04325 family)